VYFSLIDNNIISLKKLPAATSDNEINVYNTFLSKQSSVIEWLNSELNGRPTAYGKLSEEQQVYVWYVYKMLQKQGIFNTSAVDTNDEVYKQWEDENSVSLAEILKYAISQNWIDMSTLTDQKYTSLQESYDALVSYIDTVLKTDNDFSKKMYKYMIQTGQLSGREICMMLYEQGVLEDHGEYAALSAGSMSSYNFMIDAITTKKITPAQLALKPCSGSCVMTDPNNGDVIALVSYPSYDNNKLSGSVDAEYYSQLNSDKSKPLQNWATQSQSAPGSTFKPCAAIAALDTGLISTSSTYYCSGTFDKVTPPPSCWQTWGHGSQNVTQAIQHSCNVFFYNVGYDLACSRNGQYDSNYGTSILQKYAESLGLATESGIEIEESTPQASNILAFASAMGQGNHNYSCLNIARYATTLAANGTCYNLTLIDKVTDHDGNLIRDNEAKVSNTVEISSANWDAVHQGMKLAADEYFASSRLGITIAGKSGTAQESSKDPDHSLLMTYAPYENPKVATAVEIQNGYTSGTSIELTAQIYRIYLSLYPTE
jgi:penicillin-binding protein 2